MNKENIKLIYKYLVLGILTTGICFYYSIAFAAPDPRFLAMDKNGDKLVSIQEFLDSNPNMNENAFAIIDGNNDKHVTFEEWTIFQQKHSMPDGLKVDTDKITNLPAKKAPDNPDSPNTPKAPSMPTMQMGGQMQSMDSMPLMQPMKPMQSMFDKNPNEVEEVKVPVIIQNSSSLPLLSPPSVQAPHAPNIQNPNTSTNSNKTTNEELINNLMPLLNPK